jgi:hypothetical protein
MRRVAVMLMIVPVVGLIAVSVAGLSARPQSAPRDVADVEFVFETAPFASALATRRGRVDTPDRDRDGRPAGWRAVSVLEPGVVRGTRQGADAVL